MYKKEDHYCICSRPKIVIHYDNNGDAVKYCDKCWKPIK